MSDPNLNTTPAIDVQEDRRFEDQHNPLVDAMKLREGTADEQLTAAKTLLRQGTANAKDLRFMVLEVQDMDEESALLAVRQLYGCDFLHMPLPVLNELRHSKNSQLRLKAEAEKSRLFYAELANSSNDETKVIFDVLHAEDTVPSIRLEKLTVSQARVLARLHEGQLTLHVTSIEDGAAEVLAEHWGDVLVPIYDEVIQKQYMLTALGQTSKVIETSYAETPRYVDEPTYQKLSGNGKVEQLMDQNPTVVRGPHFEKRQHGRHAYTVRDEGHNRQIADTLQLSEQAAGLLRRSMNLISANVRPVQFVIHGKRPEGSSTTTKPMMKLPEKDHLLSLGITSWQGKYPHSDSKPSFMRRAAA